ncbi:hypothetical protein ABIE91_003372 [Bradyrhizobium elkanii]
MDQNDGQSVGASRTTAPASAAANRHTCEGNDADRRQNNHDLENRAPKNRSNRTHQSSVDPAGSSFECPRAAISGASSAGKIRLLKSASSLLHRLMSFGDKSVDLLLQLCFHFGDDVVRQASAKRIGCLVLLPGGLDERGSFKGLILDQSSRGHIACRASRHVSPVGFARILIRLHRVLHELCLLAPCRENSLAQARTIRLVRLVAHQ